MSPASASTRAMAADAAEVSPLPVRSDAAPCAAQTHRPAEPGGSAGGYASPTEMKKKTDTPLAAQLSGEGGRRGGHDEEGAAHAAPKE